MAGIKEMARLKKADKKAARMKQRWANCPYYANMLDSNISIFTREVTIDNSELIGKYKTFLTTNGHYTYMEIGKNYTSDTWKKKFGAKRIFNESELLYMPDYNRPMQNNVGYMLSMMNMRGSGSLHKGQGVLPVCGSWMDGGSFISLLIQCH